jgi:hypothetical protein
MTPPNPRGPLSTLCGWHIYATNRNKICDFRKLQRGLISMEVWCDHWNININEDKIQAIYFSHRCWPVDAQLRLKGRNIPSVNEANYLGNDCHEGPSNIHENLPLLKIERLSVKSKWSLYKALVRSKFTYAYPACEFAVLLNRFLSHFVSYQGAQWPALYIRRSKFRSLWLHNKIYRKQAKFIQNQD